MTTISVKDQMSTSTSVTRLTGPRLWAVRGVWFAVTVLGVSLFVLAIPARYRELATICSTLTECASLQVTPAGATAVRELGWTLEAYATITFIPELLSMLVGTTAGLIVFWRRSDDWMAVFTSLTLILFGTVLQATIQVLGVRLPALRPILQGLLMVAFACYLILLFVFPNGQFVPRWLRWPALILTLVSAPVIPSMAYTAAGAFLTIPPLSLGVWSQIHRYRKMSSPTERQQTKWVLIGFGFFAIGVVFFTLPFILLPAQFDPAALAISSKADIIYNSVYAFFFVFLPFYVFLASFAIATLRYRLWDVDPILNRSLIYGGLTIVLGGLFAAGFFGLRKLLEAALGGEQAVLAAVVATAAVLLLFNPARRWLRRFVDRRIYGIEIEYRTPPARRQLRSVTSSRTVFGDFTHLEPVGSGGMAEVYRAQHPTLGHTVAIKVLPARLARDPAFRRRFEREAQATAALKHPNIVGMLDYGVLNDTHYMVLEFVDGADLGQFLRDTGSLSLAQTVPILSDVASALDYAHEQGLVHRDVKPSNVMLEPATSPASGKPYRAVLTDFGIARILTGGTNLTASGMVGTFAYIAPEQIQAASNVDGRADVYGLGVVAYLMLTGHLPFEQHNTGAVLMAHLMQPAPDPRTLVPDLPAGVAGAIQQAMAKAPDERFASAGAFVEALNSR